MGRFLRVVAVCALLLMVACGSHDVPIMQSSKQDTDAIDLRIDILMKQQLIRNQIDEEFRAMSEELANLHDPRVARIMTPHLQKIAQYAAAGMAVSSDKETR